MSKTFWGLYRVGLTGKNLRNNPDPTILAFLKKRMGLRNITSRSFFVFNKLIKKLYILLIKIKRGIFKHEKSDKKGRMLPAWGEINVT